MSHTKGFSESTNSVSIHELYFQYNFEGRYDIVKFAKLVGSSGLYLLLRIGPYVCAEWNFGLYSLSHSDNF